MSPASVIVFLCLLSSAWTERVSGRSLRIIVPRKINYIHHHHHHQPFDAEGKKHKRFAKLKVPIQHRHVHHHHEEKGEESEEEVIEIHRDKEFDAAEDGDYYAVPALYKSVRPLYLYNDRYRRRKQPVSYEHLSYEDYLQRLKLPEKNSESDLWFWP